MMYQQYDAAENGAALRLAHLVGNHDRVQVGRDVEYAGCKQQCQRALDAIVLTQVHGRPAARAVMVLGGRQLTANVAGGEIARGGGFTGHGQAAPNCSILSQH